MSMKTLVKILSVGALVFSLAGCGAETTNQTVKPEAAEETTTNEPEARGTLKSDVTAIAAEGTVGDYTYSVTQDPGYFQQSKIPGYYADSLDQPNSPIFFFITSGKQPTGGYEVIVTGLEVDENDHMTITVAFVSPGPDDIVTQEITYPMTQVTVDHYPTEITIKTIDGMEVAQLN